MNTSRFILFLIICIFIFPKISYSSQYKQLYIPQVNSKIQIIFDKKNLKKYFKHLTNISTRDKVFLEDKKSFNIKVEYDGQIIKAKAKIAGNSVDHVDFRRGFSSLSIKLLDNHIGNITNFRILKLGSKFFENEIFWSALMETLGYPTPYSRLINVNFNENEYLMIFQEKTEKEFLERWSIPEAPIIKGAYKQFQALHGECVKLGETPSACSAKYLYNVFYSNRIENKKYIKNINSAKIAYKGTIMTDYYQFKKFYDLNSMYAKHGLNKKNSKFFYDPLYNFKQFIYYDGDVNFAKFNGNNCNDSNYHQFTQNEKFIYFKDIYFQRTELELDSVKKCIAIKYLSNKNNYYEKISFKNINLKSNFETINSEIYKAYSSPIKKINGNKLGFKPNYLMFSQIKNSFLYCLNINDRPEDAECKIEKDVKRIKDLLAIDRPKKKFNQYDVYDLILKPIEKNIDKINKFKIVLENKNEKIQIDKNTTVFLKIKKTVKSIDVNLKDNNSSRLVIHGKVPPNINIFVTSKLQDKQNYIIYDENSLTGCLTFLDANLENLNLIIENSQCEDSVNFIRTFGSINSIKVKNSSSDAIDMDFSNLKVKLVEVDNSLNDCLDLSFGEYFFEKIILNNCGDKAVSVGEKSKAVIEISEISNSRLAAATKDSSVSYFEKLFLNNVDLCFDNYNKKQEFDGGLTFLKNDVYDKCKGKMKFDSKSNIEIY